MNWPGTKRLKLKRKSRRSGRPSTTSTVAVAGPMRTAGSRRAGRRTAARGVMESPSPLVGEGGDPRSGEGEGDGGRHETPRRGLCCCSTPSPCHGCAMGPSLSHEGREIYLPRPAPLCLELLVPPFLELRVVLREIVVVLEHHV